MPGSSSEETSEDEGVPRGSGRLPHVSSALDLTGAAIISEGSVVADAKGGLAAHDSALVGRQRTVSVAGSSQEQDGYCHGAALGACGVRRWRDVRHVPVRTPCTRQEGGSPGHGWLFDDGGASLLVPTTSTPRPHNRHAIPPPSPHSLPCLRLNPLLPLALLLPTAHDARPPGNPQPQRRRPHPASSCPTRTPSTSPTSP